MNTRDNYNLEVSYITMLLIKCHDEYTKIVYDAKYLFEWHAHIALQDALKTSCKKRNASRLSM